MKTYNKNRPDVNISNSDSLVGATQFSFYKMMQQIQTMLPAKVIKYDRETNRVQVQILINILGTSGEQYPNSQVASIPVMIYGGGDFLLSFNLNPGDLGWIVANDRDISLFLQTYEAAAPSNNLIKNFSNAMFMPDVMRGYTIAPEDSGNAVLQNKSGSVKVSLSADTITISAPTVVIEGQTESTLNLITPTGGTLRVVGNIEATGDITPNVPP